MMKIIARGTILDTAEAKLVAVVYQNDDATETHVKLYRKEFDAAAIRSTGLFAHCNLVLHKPSCGI